MKASQRSQCIGATGVVHNHRQFLEKAEPEPIDDGKVINGQTFEQRHDEWLAGEKRRLERLEKAKQNVYLGHYDEVNAYQRYYSDKLNHTNDCYRKSHHLERCKTMKQYYDAHPPEETIFQIGDMKEHASPEMLKACITDYYKRMNAWSAAHGNIFGILNISFHNDETTPHCHVRRLWFAKDKDGNVYSSIDKALEQAGIDRPDLIRRDGRYNNRKESFDKEMRELWITVCRDHGFEIDDVPRPHKKHLGTREFERVMEERDNELNQQAMKHHETIEDMKQLEEFKDLQKLFPDEFTAMRTEAVERFAEMKKEQEKQFTRER